MTLFKFLKTKQRPVDDLGEAIDLVQSENMLVIGPYTDDALLSDSDLKEIYGFSDDQIDSFIEHGWLPKPIIVKVWISRDLELDLIPPEVFEKARNQKQ